MFRRIALVITGFVSFAFMSFAWRTDFEKAKNEAKAENKLIILKFSGSDWCLPCIRMEKQLFMDTGFSAYAEKNLKMVNADFPRLKKNHLDKVLTKQNEALAEQYNKEGHFPYTILMNADGKVLKVWDGYEGEKPQQMISEIEQYVAAR